MAVHLVNKVIIYQLTPQTLQVAVNFTMSHRPFQVRLCHLLYRFEKINLRNIAEAGARTHDLYRCSLALATRPPTSAPET